MPWPTTYAILITPCETPLTSVNYGGSGNQLQPGTRTVMGYRPRIPSAEGYNGFCYDASAYRFRNVHNTL